MAFLVRDPRRSWITPIIETAESRGIKTGVIETPEDITPDDIVFMRPHANPRVLPYDQTLYEKCSTRCIQDWRQVMWYDYKRAQIDAWSHWMPDTWVFSNLEAAMDFAETTDVFPIVSKADVGASSYNVRILYNRQELVEHLKDIWINGGIRVEHCSSDGAWSMQTDYCILQRFIPHQTTYRVNIVGRENAIFFRHCYPDRPVAQTGNTDPAYELTPELEDLLDFSNRFFAEAETNWCALDVLRDGDSWKSLETSLCWPWPSPGDCDNATFFPSGRKWTEMWDLMFDQLEDVWGHEL